ncbi:MAG: magnesium transporter CorA family protein [Brevundimonas sp.]
MTPRPGWRPEADVVWIDLFQPSREEELIVEAALGLQIPTREEMSAIEESSRLYRVDGATFVVADLLKHGDDEAPELEGVTCVLTKGPLVTIRYFDPKPVQAVWDRLLAEPAACVHGSDVFLAIMEAAIDRLSAVLRRVDDRVEGIAQEIFSGGRTGGFAGLIARLGRAHIATARIEESLAGLSRIFVYVGLDGGMDRNRLVREHLRSLRGDAESLNAHAEAVAANIEFQLNAALGLINVEQSAIIKIFSVAAAAFLPPTLIASIYGMNFQHMPELSRPWAYPAALLAMVASAVLPLLWFRRKGWI